MIRLALRLCLVLSLFVDTASLSYSPADTATECEQGILQRAPGLVSQANPPFSVRLYTEFTDVEVTHWVSGRNYDLVVETPDQVHYGIAAVLVRDLNSPSAYSSLAQGNSDDDIRGMTQPYIASDVNLRCSGSGYAVPGSNATEITNRRSVRVTVRAPHTSTNLWTTRVSILSFPSPPYDVLTGTTTAYSSWPTGAELGRLFVFNASFDARPVPIIPTCGYNTVSTCLHPQQTYRSCFEDTSAKSCNSTHVGAVTSGPLGEIFVGTRTMLYKTTGNLQQIYSWADTNTGPAQLLALPQGLSLLLSCGSGWGRPRCEYRHLTNLSLFGTQWIATGVIPRIGKSGPGLICVNRSIFSSRYQVGLPTRMAFTDANVISRSELSATTNWTYRYSENSIQSNENNGLFQSTNLRNRNQEVPWLAQPIDANRETLFTIPWTKGESDPYVYFGLYEYVRGSYFSRVARVCKTEGDPRMLRNNFNTFLKMDVACSWNSHISRSYSAVKLTASGSGTGPNAWLYMAFASEDGTGSAICAFSYADPGGIDFEMGGKIDTSITGSPFWTGAARFYCNRSSDDARRLFYVHPLHQESGYEGKSNSTKVMWADEGPGSTVRFMTIHTETHTQAGISVEILWTINEAGILSKILPPIDHTLPAALLQTYDLNGAEPTALHLDDASGHILVGTRTDLLSIPLGNCERYSTCSSCIAANDPYCGWCSQTTRCTRSRLCASNSSWNFNHTVGVAIACSSLPMSVTFDVVAIESRRLRVLIQIQNASSSNITANTSESTALLDVNSTIYAVGIDQLPLVVNVSQLVPNTAYHLEVSSRSAGGRIQGGHRTIFTAQEAPSQLSMPEVQMVNSTCVYVTWEPPSSPNGVVFRYRLRRNDSEICCRDATQLYFVNCGLQPYTQYSFDVAGVTGSPQVPFVGPSSIPITVRTSGSRPSAPQNLSIGTVTNTTIGLMWNRPTITNGPLTSYAILMNDTLIGDRPANYSTEYVVEKLYPFTTYSFAVQAVSSFGVSNLSSTTSATTLVGIPSRLPPPVLTPIVSSTGSDVLVQWEAEQSYPVVTYQLLQGFSDGSTSILFNGTSLNATVRVNPCTYIEFGVQTVTAAGAGDVSGFRSLRTASRRPVETPNTPWAVSRSQGAVTLQFAIRGCDAIGYYISQRVQGTSIWSEVASNATVPNGNRQFTVFIEGLYVNNTYEFALSEEYRNSDGSSVRSPWSPPFVLNSFDLDCALLTTISPTDGPSTQPTHAPSASTAQPTHSPSVSSTTAYSTEYPSSNCPPPGPVTLSPMYALQCSTICSTLAEFTAAATTVQSTTSYPLSSTPTVLPSIFSSSAPSSTPSVSPSTIPSSMPVLSTTSRRVHQPSTSASSFATSTSMDTIAFGQDTNNACASSFDSIGAIIGVAILAGILFVVVVVLQIKIRSLERSFGRGPTQFEKANGAYARPLAQGQIATGPEFRDSKLVLDSRDISMDGMGYLDIGGLDDEELHVMTSSQRRPASTGRDSLLDSENESQAKLDGALSNHAHDTMLDNVTFGRAPKYSRPANTIDFSAL